MGRTPARGRRDAVRAGRLAGGLTRARPADAVGVPRRTVVALEAGVGVAIAAAVSLVTTVRRRGHHAG